MHRLKIVAGVSALTVIVLFLLCNKWEELSSSSFSLLREEALAVSSLSCVALIRIPLSMATPKQHSSTFLSMLRSAMRFLRFWTMETTLLRACFVVLAS